MTGGWWRMAWWVVVLAWPLSGQAGPAHFASLAEMGRSLRDFPAENNQFQVISEKPPHIRVSPLVFKEDCSSVTDDASRRAMLYGVYRTFIHTSAKEVKVTVVPLDHRSHQLQDAFAVTTALTRDRALALARLHLGVHSLDELVESQAVSGGALPDQWADSFKRALFEERKPPGLKLFFQEVMGKKKGSKKK